MRWHLHKSRFWGGHIYHLLRCIIRVRSSVAGGIRAGKLCRHLLEYMLIPFQNRMQESLVLFESVINSRWFLRTSVILFLNKIDLFKQKLPKVPLVQYFPEYTGMFSFLNESLYNTDFEPGGADINKAAKYILWRFTQTNRARLSVYPHLTQATDTSNVRLPYHFTRVT